MELHPYKHNILHNQRHRRTRARPEHVSRLPCRWKSYPSVLPRNMLGRKFIVHRQHSCEVDGLIAAGWRTFHSLKRDPTTRARFLRAWTRLFNGTVTPIASMTVLPGLKQMSWNAGCVGRAVRCYEWSCVLREGDEKLRVTSTRAGMDMWTTWAAEYHVTCSSSDAGNG